MAGLGCASVLKGMLGRLRLKQGRGLPHTAPCFSPPLSSSESSFRQLLAPSQGWVGPEGRRWVERPTLAVGFSSQPTGAMGLRAHTLTHARPVNPGIPTPSGSQAS